MACRSCGRENRADARFCDGCGAALDAAPGDSEAGERRQITILFCDLADSVSLSTSLDPEDFGRLMQVYEAAGVRAVEGFGGHIAQFLGDGLVVYFGYPQGHERAAELAVRAGLALLHDVARLETPSGVPLAVRVGIHTGEVVVQSMGRGERREPLALGDVVNIAARAQSSAEAGTVAITGTTRRLVEGTFALESLGRPAMKGVDRPLELLRVDGIMSERSTPAARAVSPFVGRRDELALLLDCWESARDGYGRVVHVSGEPGIGKSRLVAELQVKVSAQSHLWLECGGATHSQHTPFAALAEMMVQAFGWKPDHPNDARLDDLDAGLTASGLDPANIAPLLLPVLGLVAEPGRYPGELRSAEQQRHDLQVAMVEWLIAVSADRPLVVLTEDLHWLDPSSTELLERMALAIESRPVLMIQTSRPELVPPLAVDHLTVITLERLVSDEVEELVARIAPDHASPAQLARVVERAGGVPLYVEEVLRASTDDELELGTAVPPTLRDALAARLDRLGDAKGIAQTASVLGMEFDLATLAAIADAADDLVQLRLEQLVDQEVTAVTGRGASAVYRFTHALLQETAYASLLRARRQELHGRAADVVSASDAHGVGFQEVRAQHLAAAGRTDEAIAAWEAAAIQAFARCAMIEAESHVRAALGLLDDLTDAAARAPLEMRLEILFARVSSGTHGIASDHVRACYERAMVIADSLDDRSLARGLLFGAWGNAFSHGDIGEAERHLKALRGEATSTDDAAMEGWLAFAEATTAFAGGDIVRADGLLAQVFGGDTSGDAISFGPDLAAIAITHRALAAWMLGRVDDAVHVVEQELARAESASPWQLAMVLMASCCLRIRMRDVERVREDAHRLLEIGEQSSLPTMVAWAELYRGWALAELGAAPEGLASMRSGLAAYLATGQRTGHPGYLRWIAAAQLRAGQTVAAIETITQAERALPEEVFDVPVIWQTRGEILELDPSLAVGAETPEQCYELAVSSARRLGSVLLELPAATRLARVRAHAGNAGATERLIAPLLERIVGGDDLADVREARALIDCV
jgi:class 3 adenylate cyclase/tetratricopeptide (TPR) repeat protein